MKVRWAAFPRAAQRLVALGLCIFAVGAVRASELAALRSAAATITANRLQRHVDVLADDAFEGREGGSRGGRAAAVYLMKCFEQCRLSGGAGDGGYFQPFGAEYRNVLAWIEGSDPRLAREVVILSAHYDHVGYGNAVNSNGPTGYIHNGADDNASGTATLLEVVQALTQLPTRPRRSILVALWDGEEKNLLGSRHWVEHPTIPLRDVALMFNLDMVGRLREQRLEAIGSRTAAGLREALSRANEEVGLELDFSWELKQNSDHYTFYSRQVPVVMLHTGLHEDYHRPSDDAHKVNAEGMQRITRLAFHALWEVANRPQRFAFRPQALYESVASRQQFEQQLPPLPPRLGVFFGPPLADRPGLHLTAVSAGSAAELAGLRAGDRLLALAGRPLLDAAALRTVALAAAGTLELEVAREGADEPLNVQLEPSGNPIRLGITWRENDAEPGAVTVVRVVPGSPADRAGLKWRDRIYEVSGQRFANSQEFLALVSPPPATLPLRLERAGRLQSVVIDTALPEAAALGSPSVP
jgi:hypothetical protein